LVSIQLADSILIGLIRYPSFFNLIANRSRGR